MKRILPIFLILAAACARPKSNEPAAAPDTNLRITGPYTHENLSVYLLHSATQDDRDFITLDEGLKDGSVTVTEKEQEQVGELLLENNSSKPLFVQEGDRVQGGKQDRIVGLSFVVPAKSGKQPIPSFCVEQGRWESQEGEAGWKFGGNDNRALATKPVRAAAKADKDQSEVWRKVSSLKSRGGIALEAPNTNTSLNETMENEKARKAMDPVMKALEGVLAGKPDAIGVAFALNGKIEEVNLYPGHKLLAKLYPRLLGSYALSAVLDRKGGRPPASWEVGLFMKETREKAKRQEQVADNCVTVRQLEANVKCLTEYQGKAVHTQWMRRDDTPRPAAGEEVQQAEQRLENESPRQRR